MPSAVADVIISVACLLVAAIVHEVSHGLVALWCGDDTARRAGRLTLNPARHIDPFGSIVLPTVMAMAGGVAFAYAKPVPYDPSKLRNRRVDEVLVALAGPASNLLQALVCAGALHLSWSALSAGGGSCEALWLACYVLVAFLRVNVMLMCFNLIPLPPLDGSKVVCFFLKGDALRRYYEVQAYAMPILIIVLYLVPSVLGVDPLGWVLQQTAGRLTGALLGAAL